LGLLTAAALLPDNWQYRILDMNTRPLREEDLAWADIVGTGGMMGQYEGAVEVARRCHALGKPVVVGGPDPTLRRDQYPWADYLVLDEAELTIPFFLRALENGATGGRFETTDRADMTTAAVVPRYDLVNPSDYLFYTVQYSRGCPYFCDFCEIPHLLGRKMRCKTPEHVQAELDAILKSGFVGQVEFVDDNFIGDKKQTKQLLPKLRAWLEKNRYPMTFSCQASCNIAADEELLRLMREGNFNQIFQGIESADKEVLRAIQKNQNVHVPFVKANEKILANGMIINAGFIVGFDHDTDESADASIHLITASHIVNVMLSRLFAVPGTALYDRLEREGRLQPVRPPSEDADHHAASGLVQLEPTSIGLNFATKRPKSAILRDYIKILQKLYSVDGFYARAQSCCLHLKPSAKRILRRKEIVKMLAIFLRVCLRAGFRRETRRHYWRLLATVASRNRATLDRAVGFAAMYEHFREQAAYLIQSTREALAYYEVTESTVPSPSKGVEVLARH
jgi:hypothetical protein